MKFICIFMALAFSAGPSYAEKADLNDVVVKRKSPEKAETNWNPYGSVEFRHYTNTYYDQDNFLTSQTPSFHTLAQLGLNLYGGFADLYTTIGAVKLAGTQQILQRRPQIELDIYPIYNSWLSMTQYTIVETPYSDSQYIKDNIPASRHGSIITVGLAQKLKYKTSGDFAKWQFSVGTDIWTKLYSRKQPKSIPDEEMEKYSLRGGEEYTDPTGESESPDANGEVMTGVTLVPTDLPSWKFSTTVHFTRKQSPEYFYDEDRDAMDYTFKKKDSSHYKLRISVKLTESTYFINDFYHFHDGFFEARTQSADDRRLRNIARVQIHL